MGFWAWFAIWTGLVIGAGLVFAVIGFNLSTSAKALAKESAKLTPILEDLSELVESVPSLAAPVSALESDLAAIISKRSKLVAAKKRKHDERQRRLIRHLKDIDPQEKRFK